MAQIRNFAIMYIQPPCISQLPIVNLIVSIFIQIFNTIRKLKF